jgi:uncharacterized protein (TIGR03083 family)
MCYMVALSTVTGNGRAAELPLMDIASHCAHLEREGETFAALVDAVAPADRDQTVTTCPDWDLAELFRHVGGLYRWSEWLVREQVGKETWRAALPIEYPEADSDWGAWLRDGLRAAVGTFRTADPYSRVWTWGSDQHARFWPRRMLFETVAHRCDAEITLHDKATEIDPEVAVDGIDEYLEHLPSIARWNPAVAQLRAEDRWSLAFAATDTGDNWRVRVGAHGWNWDRTDGDASARVTGTAHDVLLWLLGRPAPDLERGGDASALARWTAATAF